MKWAKEVPLLTKLSFKYAMQQYQLTKDHEPTIKMMGDIVRAHNKNVRQARLK